jgi:hypothetical protein
VTTCSHRNYAGRFKKIEGFKPDGAIQKMRCRFLSVHGEGDRQTPFERSQKMIAAAGSQKKEMKAFTRAEVGYHHCQVDNISVGSA